MEDKLAEKRSPAQIAGWLAELIQMMRELRVSV
jgi:hypothetical protein